MPGIHRTAEPARLSKAGNPVLDNDVERHVAPDVRQNMILHDRIGPKVAADLGMHVVPRPPNLRAEKSAQRTEVFAEVLRPSMPASQHAFADWQPGVA